MRILVVGSFAHTNNQTAISGESFDNACYLLGQELGRAKCVVVLGSNRAHTADHHVMRGLRTVPGTHRVIIVRPVPPVEVSLPSSSEGTSLASEATPTTGSEGQLDVTYVPVRGPWGVGRVTQLLQCDAVIAIGGRSGTADIIALAPELRRPVVAIPSFGGEAYKAWNNLLRDYSFIGDRRHDYYILAQSWRDEHAKMAVDLARLLVRRNPYDDGTRRFLWNVFVWNGVLVGLWAIIFSYPCTLWGTSVGCSGNRVNIFLLFWLSAFIGSGLRAAKRALDDPTERSSRLFILTESAIGLAVSFGLSLIYMAGLFLTSATPDPFSLLSDIGVDKEKPGEFRRTAVLLSTIAFTSAFLLEGSFVKLQDKLRERVLEEK